MVGPIRIYRLQHSTREKVEGPYTDACCPNLSIGIFDSEGVPGSESRLLRDADASSLEPKAGWD